MVLFARLAAAALALLLALAPVSAAAEPIVTGARIIAGPDRTRFVLDITEAVPLPQVRILGEPGPRALLDFGPLHTSLADCGSTGSGLIERWNCGLRNAATGDVLFVLYATGPFRVDNVAIQPPSGGEPAHLIVDLVPVTAAAFAAALDVAWSTSSVSTPASAAPRPVVVIDAGHGGYDSGALHCGNGTDSCSGSGSGDVLEKNITLAVARLVAQNLTASGLVEVHLTRDSDVFVSLQNRVLAAQNVGADLFVSIHADSVDEASLRGGSVYTYSRTPPTDPLTAALREQINDTASPFAGAVDPNAASNALFLDLLAEMQRTHTVASSISLADRVVDAMAAANVRLLTNPHRVNSYTVLSAPHFPSILIELGFVSNADDRRNLTSASWQAMIARTIADAILNQVRVTLLAQY